MEAVAIVAIAVGLALAVLGSLIVTVLAHVALRRGMHYAGEIKAPSFALKVSIRPAEVASLDAPNPSIDTTSQDTVVADAATVPRSSIPQHGVVVPEQPGEQRTK